MVDGITSKPICGNQPLKGLSLDHNTGDERGHKEGRKTQCNGTVHLERLIETWKLCPLVFECLLPRTRLLIYIQESTATSSTIKRKMHYTHPSLLPPTMSHTSWHFVEFYASSLDRLLAFALLPVFRFSECVAVLGNMDKSSIVALNEGSQSYRTKHLGQVRVATVLNTILSAWLPRIEKRHPPPSSFRVGEVRSVLNYFIKAWKLFAPYGCFDGTKFRDNNERRINSSNNDDQVCRRQVWRDKPMPLYLVNKGFGVSCSSSPSGCW